jgi:hypothetical protein
MVVDGVAFERLGCLDFSRRVGGELMRRRTRSSRICLKADYHRLNYKVGQQNLDLAHKYGIQVELHPLILA